MSSEHIHTHCAQNTHTHNRRSALTHPSTHTHTHNLDASSYGSVYLSALRVLMNIRQHTNITKTDARTASVQTATRDFATKTASSTTCQV